MEDCNPEECQVCVDNYDQHLRRPRCLPCGHTVCSRCINIAIRRTQLTCPICRTKHNARIAEDFSVNYSFEMLINKHKDTPFKAEGKVSKKHYKVCHKGILKKVLPLMRKQKVNISSLVTSCKEALSQLVKYQEHFNGYKIQHHQLQEKIIEQNSRAIGLLELEDTRVMHMITEGEERLQQLQFNLGCLDTGTSSDQFFTSIDEADHCNEMVEKWLQRYQDIFPEVNAIHTSVKVQENIKKALKMISIHMGNPKWSRDLNKPKCRTKINELIRYKNLETYSYKLMEKVEAITLNTSKELRAEHLRILSEPFKNLMTYSRVFAVHQTKTTNYYARIQLEWGNLCLDTLKKQPLPINAHTILHRDVMNMLDPSSLVAFLDLKYENIERARVYIRLRSKSSMSRMFRNMCTGHRGYTFYNTKLTSVVGKGEPGEYVVGGDYNEWDDPITDAGPSMDFDGNAWESISAGAVWHVPFSSTLFHITTRDCEGDVHKNVFGEVERGLDVVKAIAKLKNVSKVTIINCGIVLPS
nr:uncharacterized protein LOC128689379 [Cherax quadricarinatus]XP_053633565.1 uncharacterized protein LOC128689379 [Cherax quadricarinatus]XP_053633566.1 uncharacterized protein LOC128689379 [Cherax quadricarinatus]XP_053633567.1 uncharacterized protein LOC128689379 [Cherax quadricarinatus]